MLSVYSFCQNFPQVTSDCLSKNSEEFAKGNKVWVTVLIAINFMEQDTSNQKDNKHKQRETNRELF